MTDLEDFLDQPFGAPLTPPNPAAPGPRIDERRFWARVQFGEDCWEWQGHANGRFGYGRIQVRGERILTHRAAWELSYGPIPDGLLVLHKCDNPKCVRPSHLFLGTAGDNNRDRDQKGRTSSGERHAMRTPVRRGSEVSRVLTEAQVLEIRSRYTGRRGEQKELAEEYGVHRTVVHRIVHRATWSHV